MHSHQEVAKRNAESVGPVEAYESRVICLPKGTGRAVLERRTRKENPKIAQV